MTFLLQFASETNKIILTWAICIPIKIVALLKFGLSVDYSFGPKYNYIGLMTNFIISCFKIN